MKKIVFGMLLVFCMTTLASAIPSLQVGAPAGPGDSGIYADYRANLSNPSEEDTAVTSGGTIYAAGAYKKSGVLLLGGQYDSSLEDWTDFGFDSAFAGAGAVLMATVADGSLGSGTLTVNGMSSIYSTSTYKDGFTVPSPPSNHDPIKDQDYLFFDIGDFENFAGAVMNFDSESGAVDGEIKSLTIATSGFGWIHFDVFALLTEIDSYSGKKCTHFVTNYDVDLEGNPGSKDVTWKESVPVPEPSVMLMLGSGLLGVVFYRRETRK